MKFSFALSSLATAKAVSELFLYADVMFKNILHNLPVVVNAYLFLPPRKRVKILLQGQLFVSDVFIKYTI